MKPCNISPRRAFVIPLAGLLILLVSGLAWSDQQSNSESQGPDLAERYFAAYIALDWDVLAPMLAEQGSFADLTAEPVFGEVKADGKAAMMKNFREGYAGISHMQFNRTRAFTSGGVAVFEGTLDWDYTLESGKVVVTREMPFVTILKLVDGKVIEHRDYADYQPFIDAYKKVTAQ